MAKNKKTGLGKGLDSLIPDYYNEESSVSLEDMLKDNKEVNEELNSNANLDEDNKEDSAEKSSGIKVKANEKNLKKPEKNEPNNPLSDNSEKSADNTKLNDLNSSVAIDNKLDSENNIAIDNKLDSEDNIAIDNKLDIENNIATDNNIKNNEDNSFDNFKEDIISVNENNNVTSDLANDEKNIKTSESFNKDLIKSIELSSKELELIDEVKQTVQDNPRITLWSIKSAAVFRYLRKTKPEFSISKEASFLIDEAVKEKYPEVWNLFDN